MVDRQRGSSDAEQEVIDKEGQEETDETGIKLEIRQGGSVDDESDDTTSKMFQAGINRNTEKRTSKSHKDSTRHSTGHDGECKRFALHQGNKLLARRRKLSIFKKQSTISETLKGKQVEIESDLRKKVLRFMNLQKDDDDEYDE
jgi:hypothetical protein